MQKLAGGLVLLLLGVAHAQNGACERLAQVTLPQAKIAAANDQGPATQDF